MRQEANAGSRSAAIDGIRAIAALAVLMHHFQGGVILPFLDLGRFGVVLFFITSGYCIASSTANRPHIGVGNFLLRRAFRLYPAYWIAVVLSVIVATEPFPASVVVANFTMFQKVLGLPDVNGLFWTLFIEIIFYGIFSVLILFNWHGPMAITWFCCLSTIAAVAAATFRYNGMHVPYGHMLFISAFFVGSAIFHHREKVRSVLFGVSAYAMSVLLISVLVFGDQVIGGEKAYSHFGNYALALLIFVIGVYGRLTGWRPLADLGKISYCIYLYHSIIQPYVDELISDRMVAFVVHFTITLLLSTAVYRWIERPCMNLGSRFSIAKLEFRRT